MKDYKKSYKEVLGDNFPDRISVSFGDQKLTYIKRKWNFKDEEIGLRYGDNPGQEAAIYQLKDGNLKLGECQYVGSDDSLISGVSGDELVEGGKHIGKSNLSDVDAPIVFHNHFCY